jgi:hypothetical protein
MRSHISSDAAQDCLRLSNCRTAGGELLAGKHPQLASVHVVVGNLGRRLLGCVS